MGEASAFPVDEPEASTVFPTPSAEMVIRIF